MKPKVESSVPLRFKPDAFELIRQAAEKEGMTIVEWCRETCLEMADQTLDRGPFNVKARRPVREMLERPGQRG